MPSLRPNKKSFFLLHPAAAGILYEDDAAHQQGCPATVMRMVVVMCIAAGTESGDWELIARGLRKFAKEDRRVQKPSAAQGGGIVPRNRWCEGFTGICLGIFQNTCVHWGPQPDGTTLSRSGNSRPHLKQMHHLCVCVCMCVCVRVIYLFAVECITLPNPGLDPNECSNTQANCSEMFLN